MAGLSLDMQGSFHYTHLYKSKEPINLPEVHHDILGKKTYQRDIHDDITSKKNPHDRY